MITERELDAQLTGAAGISDADLPALPEDFLRHVQALADGSEPASVVAARQLVDGSRQARTAPGRRRRRPGRTIVLRAGDAVVTLAAAWLAAVVVAPSDGTGTAEDRIATPSAGSEAPTPGGIALVAAEEVTFPLSLDPAPEGLTASFSRFGGVAPCEDSPLVFTADYRSADTRDGFTLWLHSVDPRGLDSYFQPEDSPDFDPATRDTTDIDGTAAEAVRTDSFAHLLWERPDGRWVQILGDGAYGDTAALVAVAESIVDRPKPVGLQFGLAPVGWSVTGYERAGASTSPGPTTPGSCCGTA